MMNPHPLDAPKPCYGSQSDADGVAPDMESDEPEQPLALTPQPAAVRELRNNREVLEWLSCLLLYDSHITGTGKVLTPYMRAAQFIAYGNAIADLVVPVGETDEVLPDLPISNRVRFDLQHLVVRVCDEGVRVLSDVQFGSRVPTTDEILLKCARVKYWLGEYDNRDCASVLASGALRLRTMILESIQARAVNHCGFFWIMQRMEGIDLVRCMLHACTDPTAAGELANLRAPLYAMLSPLTRLALDLENTDADRALWLHYSINSMRKDLQPTNW